MPKLNFPPGKTIIEGKVYSKEFFELTLSEIFQAGDFTGYLEIEAGDEQLILFFLKGKSYAAAMLEGQRPRNLGIREFFGSLPHPGRLATVSLHATDPVLFKGMLVFFQLEPSIKAATKIINFDDIMCQIGEGASSVIVLRKNNMMNFFFFMKGKPVMAHFADPVAGEGNNDPIADRMLLYAYPADMTPVDAMIYMDTATEAAEDSDSLTEIDLLDMTVAIDSRPSAQTTAGILIEVIEGPEKEKRFFAALPCTIGRKEGDIILHDQQVSGKHAMVREQHGRFFIEDLGSTNGTFIGDVEIKVREISEGDVIRVGESLLRVDELSLP